MSTRTSAQRRPSPRKRWPCSVRSVTALRSPTLCGCTSPPSTRERSGRRPWTSLCRSSRSSRLTETLGARPRCCCQSPNPPSTTSVASGARRRWRAPPRQGGFTRSCRTRRWRALLCWAMSMASWLRPRSGTRGRSSRRRSDSPARRSPCLGPQRTTAPRPRRSTSLRSRTRTSTISRMPSATASKRCLCGGMWAAKSLRARS
mmetsp:Transcript_50762/g.146420  ORF Transcript_50762/g.146420 Transcript_50762/m.146420 type:complete len:203 (-) Transcript_50762:1739-2347(-)